MTDILCPHCGEAQMDCHNGGDPGSWWGTEHIPEGACEVDCDHCGKEFIVTISWTPTFEGVTSNDQP